MKRFITLNIIINQYRIQYDRCAFPWINRIYHRSPMQIEQFQPEGKRMMPETRFTEFPDSSVHPRVVISRSASEKMIISFSCL